MSCPDILIIRPCNQTDLYGALSQAKVTGIEPPLWAAINAAFLRQAGYRVEILDAEVMGLSHAETAQHVKDINPLLVNVAVSGTNPSSSTWNMSGAGLLAKTIKTLGPEKKIIISGLHPSALPERTLRDEAVDFVCQGEGFVTFPALIDKLRSQNDRFDEIPGLWYRQENVIRSNPRASLMKNLDNLPMPAWDMLPMPRYRAHNWHCLDGNRPRQPYGVIYTSLGCPYACSFCCINSFFGKNTIRFRSPDNVVNEIDFLVKHYDIHNIRIIDEMFVLRPSHVNRLCDLIAGRGYDLNMWVYARVDTVTSEMLKKMKKAGINWICYGFESANQDVLDDVRKGYTKTDVYEAVKITGDAGIYILANYMFGLPNDNIRTMQETLAQAIDLNCEYANFYCCMAYPGSKLYDEAVRNGVSLPSTWEGYSQLSPETLPLPTKHLSSAEVLRFRDHAFQVYHSNPRYLSMIERKFGLKTVEDIKNVLSHPVRRKFA